MRTSHPFITSAMAALTAAAVVASPAAAASGWSIVTIPSGGHGGFLLGASAHTDTDAWAVGSAASGSTAVGNRPLIDHWNGTSWQQSTVPTLSTQVKATLTAVSAASATDAWAVGYTQFNHYTFTPLGFHWNGSGWTNVTSILGYRATIPAGVVDLGPNDAYMIGNDSSLASGVLEQWNGSSWSHLSLPDPDPAHPGLNTAFTAISATSPSDVWIAASHLKEFSTTLLRYEPYALHFDGTAWSVVPMPLVAGTDNLLADDFRSMVSVAPNDVWAAGGSGDSVVPPGGNTANTLTEHWNGTAWSVVTSPSAGTASALNGISARSADDIWAVGSYQPAGSTARQTLTEHWDGTSWTIQSSPDPSTSGDILTAVSTSPGAGLIWAVGYSGTSTAPTPFALEHN